jgi:hypothetical protein
LLSRVRYGSFLVYSPRGITAVSIESKGVCRAIKEDRTRWEPPTRVIAHTAGRLEERFDTTGLRSILGPQVALVPAPKSGLLMVGALWPAHRICEELVLRGLGGRILPCLKRIEPVRKSATAAAADRPKAEEHFRTMAAERALNERPPRIAVVDDVITRGASLIAAVSRVKEAFPEAEVAGFALVRTMSLGEVPQIIDPAVGEIELANDDCRRRP